MAKKFRDLRARMSRESRARAHGKAQEMLNGLPLAELRQARHFSQEQLAAENDCWASQAQHQPTFTALFQSVQA